MKKVFQIIVVIFCLSIGLTTSAQDFSILDFAGVWKVDDKESYEVWNVQDDDSLEGYAYKIKNEKPETSEYLTLKTVDGITSYSARVPNQNDGKAIDFILNTADDSGLSFENLSHDFPKKIKYTFHSEDKVMVHVSGEGDSGFSFSMTKVRSEGK